MNRPMPTPDDICECGDPRRDHKNGKGACIFNEPGRFDLSHGGKDCMRFKLDKLATAAERERLDEQKRFFRTDGGDNDCAV